MERFTIYDPDCGLDIDETKDRETWVGCHVTAARVAIGKTVALAVVAVLALILTSHYFTVPTLWKVLVPLVSAGLVGAAVAGYYYEGAMRGVEWDRAERELGNLIAKGLDRATAIKQLRLERANREAIAAAANAAAMQTGALTAIALRR